MSEERIPMTREGFDKLKAEVARLEVEMLEVTKRVAAAREMGDLSENAEYHAEREHQGMIEAKMAQIRNKLARAELFDPKTQPRDAVRLGAKVRIMDLDMDEEETFYLVGEGEANPDQNRILTSSPIGRGLLGKKKGEIADIVLPVGTVQFKVLEITFE